MIDRMARIKEKGFTMPMASDTDFAPKDFSKIRIGAQTLNDAIVSYGTLQKANARLGTKANVLKAIDNGDIEEMR